MIKRNLIGAHYSQMYNGYKFNGVIENNPKAIKFYKTIGLDIFEPKVKKDVVKKVNDK